MNNIEIYLIRHGKTYCNEQHLYCGKSDIDLSEAGICELQNNKIEFPKCDIYFTSGMKRADSTFKILCPEEEFIQLKELQEYDFGDFELKGYNDIKDIKEYVDWINDTTLKARCPSGESRFEFIERVLKGFNALVSKMIVQNKKSALGVIHGGAIGIILEKLYDDSKKFYEWQPANGDGYKLEIEVYDYNKFKIKKLKSLEK